MAISPDGKRLAAIYAAKKSRQIDVWDAVKGVVSFSLEGHTDTPLHVVYSPDGKRIATCDAQAVKLWDAKTGKELGTFKGSAKRGTKLAFSPDGTRLGVLGTKRVEVLDASSGEELVRMNGADGKSLDFSPDGQWLATGALRSGEFALWEVATGKKDRRWVLPGPVFAVAFAPDGRHLLTGNADGTVYVLRLAEPPAARTDFDALRRANTPAEVDDD